MGNRIVRLAYTDECSAAVRAVLQARRQSGLAALPAPGAEAERELYSSVYVELHKKGLGMPPGYDRRTVAAAAREVRGGRAGGRVQGDKAARGGCACFALA